MADSARTNSWPTAGSTSGTKAYVLITRCTEELYKKDLRNPDNHDGVITHLEPDILECEVKWALESMQAVAFRGEPSGLRSAPPWG